MSEPEKKVYGIEVEFKKLQDQLSNFLNIRTKLEIQFQENNLVLNEFEKLNSSPKIYKLTGCVLLNQDYNDAKSNITKRLDFIKNEIKKVDSKIQVFEKKIESLKKDLLTANI